MEILAEVMPMGFCAKCGGTVSDNSTFCGTCSPPAVGVPVYQPPPTAMSANVAGALAYLFGIVSGFIFLRIEPYDRNLFVRFHAYQSIYLNVFVIVLIVALASFSPSSMFLWGVMTLVRFLVNLAFFILYVFVMYKAFKGERFELPVIGGLPAKQAG